MIDVLDKSLWEDLIGLPFKLRGRGPRFYDCYGLVLEIHRRQGIEIYDQDYSGNTEVHRALIAANMHRWKPCDVSPGAVLLFRQGALNRHVGMAIDHDRFIHAAEFWGQVRLDKLSRGAPLHSNLLVGAYRYAHDT